MAEGMTRRAGYLIKLQGNEGWKEYAPGVLDVDIVVARMEPLVVSPATRRVSMRPARSRSARSVAKKALG